MLNKIVYPTKTSKENPKVNTLERKEDTQPRDLRRKTKDTIVN